MKKKITSWTRFKYVNPKVFIPDTIDDLKKVISESKNILIFGNRRSYSDVCLNNKVMVSMKNFKKINYFNKKKGIIETQSGILLKELIPYIVKSKWFIPVSPGTKYVSLGGMISNNIHGKNIKKNFFYDYIISIKIMLYNGEIVTCSKQRNTELFNTTIGGLGLTGVIISVKFRLKKIRSLYLERKNIYFNKTEDLFNVEKYSKGYEYNVTWLNSFSDPKKISGIHFISRHCLRKKIPELNYFYKEKKISFIHKIIFSLINNYYLYRILNFSFRIYHKYILGKFVNFEEFFYPQDKYLNWNQLYKKKNGFVEFHLFIDKKNLIPFLYIFLSFCKVNKIFSNLIVLKKFEKSKRINFLNNLSDGYGLSLDFSNDKKTKFIKNFFLKNAKKFNYTFYLAKDLFGDEKILNSKKNYLKFKKDLKKFNKKNKFRSLLSNRYKLT